MSSRATRLHCRHRLRRAIAELEVEICLPQLARGGTCGLWKRALEHRARVDDVVVGDEEAHAVEGEGSIARKALEGKHENPRSHHDAFGGAHHDAFRGTLSAFAATAAHLCLELGGGRVHVPSASLGAARTCKDSASAGRALSPSAQPQEMNVCERRGGRRYKCLEQCDGGGGKPVCLLEARVREGEYLV